MAKKNFIEGLDSIFGNDNNSEELNIITKDEKSTPNKSVRKKRSSSKDFTADLDSLLQEALQESVEHHAAKKKKKTLPVAKSKRPMQRGRIKRTLSGLDALIRQTVSSSEMEIISQSSDDPSQPKKKRVTFSFDREKVDKLKSIARLEKSYIKDIVNGIVSEYIDEYEKSKGTVDKSKKNK